MKVYGELVRAQLEILQADPSAGIEGRIWFNDPSNAVNFDNGAAVVRLLDSVNILPMKTSFVVTLNGTAADAGMTISTAGAMSFGGSTSITPTEFGYISGVTGAIQTQLNALSPAVVSSKSDTAATYTILDNDTFGTFLLTAGSSSRTITLPLAANNTNRKILIKKVDTGAGSIVIDGNGSETIDGSADFKLVDQDDFVEVQCTGSAWVVVARGIGSRTKSKVKDKTGAGYGSTNTKIRRIETSVINTGNAITKAYSSGNGNSYTINQTAIYSIVYQDASTANEVLGVSLNSNQLTSDIDTISSADRLCSTYVPLLAATANGSCSVTLRLAAGDVVRPHGSAALTATTYADFTIEKIGL